MDLFAATVHTFLVPITNYACRLVHVLTHGLVHLDRLLDNIFFSSTCVIFDDAS
jgi:hypothetical protein